MRRVNENYKSFLVLTSVLLCGVAQVFADVQVLDDWTSDNQNQDNSTSTKEYTITAPTGAVLSFDWSVDSEMNYDKLTVTLDGNVLVNEVSGDQSGSYSNDITPGTHTLVATYAKDGSGNTGKDQATLSNVKITAPDFVEIDGVSYLSTSNNTVIVSVVADTIDVTIPTTIEIDGKTYNVTEISEKAFKSCSNLTTVSLPDGVIEINANTFENCSKLTSVTLPNTLTNIGNSAFKGCSALDSVAIPQTVISIGESAFYDCTSLSEISLPNGVTHINANTFENCSKLTSVTLPNTLASIGGYAFKGCESMQTMTIPKSVSWIGNNAFNGCGGELYVNCRIPSTWQGSSPYYNNKFTKVVIGEGVKTVGSYAFYCSEDEIGISSSLSEVVLPSTLTGIEDYAFYGTNLSTIELPAGIDSIGYNALPSSMPKMICNAPTPPTLLTNGYNGTPTLGNISLIFVPQGCGQAYKDVYPWSSKVIIDGSGVTVDVPVTPGMMGEEILKQANYLADVNFLTLRGAINETDIANIKNSMPNLVSIDMSELDMKNIPSDMFENRKALLSIILPKNVETLGSNAFNGCINLESIVLPEGLKKIENGDYYGSVGCFSNCKSLKSVLFPSTLESVGNSAFLYCI